MEAVYIFIDDERNTAAQLIPTIIVRDYGSAIQTIAHFAPVAQTLYIDFDHDLGEGKNGYDVAKWLLENEIRNVRYHIHSMNPVGRANIDQLLSHYGYEQF